MSCIIHGTASGADLLAGEVAKEMGLIVQEYPAHWARYGRAAGPIRNRLMLDQVPDLVLAFHDNINASKGTKDCLEEAQRRGILIRLITHKGEKP